MTRSHHIVFVIVDGINTLDLFGPLEAFAAVNALLPGAYHWRLASDTGGPVQAATGVTIMPDCALADADTADTLIIPGGCGPRTLIPSPALSEELQKAGAKAKRVASVCTGTFLLSRSGLADTHRVATHWGFVSELATACPDLSIDEDALFLQDGKVWSSAGVTAGIDMAMAMIAEDRGETIAAAVARELVVYLRRPGSQAQFSDPLKAQSLDAGRISTAVQWISDHFASPLNVDLLAEKCAMSPRHFTRLFRETMHTSPAQYIERLRLDMARTMLAEPNARIAQVAGAVGFTNPDSFRRAFERRFGIAPSGYQAQFGLSGPHAAPAK